MSPREFMKSWPYWGLPAFAALFAPWQEKLTSLAIISSFFQPMANVATSVFGSLACMIAFAYFGNLERRQGWKILGVSIGLLVTSFSICLILSYTVGILWFPGKTATVAIWVSCLFDALSIIWHSHDRNRSFD